MNSDSNVRSALSPIKQAYLKLQELQLKLESVDRAKREPIAMVGMACRFPGGSDDPEAFWQFLRAGRDATREIPTDRWDVDEFYDANPGTPGKMYTRRGAFLDRIDLFDPQFFGIAPREAVGMDPQQRLLLEVAWEALERSGLRPDKLSGSRTGVFVGLCTNDYADRQLQALDTTKLDAYFASGVAHSIASGRLSYILGLQGPCITLDTACSSSLVAIHLACQSLRNRECNLALAGGVNIIASPHIFIALSKASMLAHDGRCKTFDASADGYGRGEGCGVVVLKRLSDAVAAGDQILALIRGTAINQDGPSSGLTAPNGPSQTSVIRDALANGDVRPSEVSYVETHGTGTVLGDPIEVQALHAAYRDDREAAQPLLIGAVKSNIGHLEGAAGIAGLIKLVMAMQHRELPASLNVDTPNPLIPWGDLSVKVVTQAAPWDSSGKRRIAGLSSFGFSGTNAHVVVEEAPAQERARSEVERPLHLLALSAASDEALGALQAKYCQHLSTDVSGEVENICYTANSCRAHFPHRAAIVVASSAEMREKLDALSSAEMLPGAFKGQAVTSDRLKVAFLFTGQGSQYAGMGRELYETQPTFKKILDQCSRLLQDDLQPDVLSVLYPESGRSTPLDETEFTQPALFSIEYALAQLWLSWGILPSMVMGHSLGEYVAACVAGVFTLEEGLRLVAARGRLMQQRCEKGMMAVVSADADRVTAQLENYRGRVSIAAFNGPRNVVISGQNEAVQELVDKFTAAGIKTKRLTVSHAFHSPLMDPMIEAFGEIAAKVKFSLPRLPIVSNLSGQIASLEAMSNPGYWTRHLREPVQFSASMRTMQESGCSVFLEVGPNPTLLGMGAQSLPEQYGIWLPSLKKGSDEWRRILESLATLYVQGADVDWTGFDRDYQRRPVVLPTYPFQRKRFWVQVSANRTPQMQESSEKPAPRTLRHPLLGRRLDSPFIKDVVIESFVSSDALPWLLDHRAFGLPVYPATAYLEMISAAAREAFGSQMFTIADLDLREAMVLEEGSVRRIQVAITPPEGSEASFQLASLAGEAGPQESGAEAKWKIHASGKILVEEFRTTPLGTSLQSLEEARLRCRHEIRVDAYHSQLAQVGMYLGPGFKGLEKLWRGEGEALGQVSLVPEIAGEAHLYRIHPGLLDSCLQPFAAAILPLEELASGGVIYMPFALDSYRIYREPGEHLWTHIASSRDRRSTEVTNSLRVDVSVFDETGALVAELLGLCLRRADQNTIAKRREGPPREALHDWLYELGWDKQPLPDGTNIGVSVSSPLQIAEDLRSYASLHRSEPGMLAFRSLFPHLGDLSRQYVYFALRDLGWDLQHSESFTIDSKAAELRVPEKHFRLFGRMIEMLQEDGIVRREEGHWRVLGKPPAQIFDTSSDRLLELYLEQYPDCSAELNMTARCGKHLAAVIQGNCEPLDLLFPNGSSEDIEKLYCDSPFARFYNGLLGEAVRTLIARLPSDRPVRILEIGGGTGSATAAVLPFLPADRTEYVFTDVSPLFFAKAREKFGEFSFMQYRVLDIEKGPASQGFEPHGYDILIAANVLHATQNLRKTLESVESLLASEGVLVLLEGTRPLHFGDLIVGITEGWWKFNDTELRRSHALISDRKWRDLLVERGFSDILTSPQDEEDDKEDSVLSYQSLILARGPRFAAAKIAPSASVQKMTTRRMMIFADHGGLGDRLCALLKQEGTDCVTVFRGERYQTLERASYQINCGNSDDFHRLFREAVATDNRPLDIVYLWPLDAAHAGVRDWQHLNKEIQWGCESLLGLVKGLVSAGSSRERNLWIVTRGAQLVDSSAKMVALAQTPVSALGNTIGLEYPELRCARIDLDPEGASGEEGDLYREFRSDKEEELIAFRKGNRHVARLRRLRRDSATTKDGRHAPRQEAYAVRTSSPGVLDGLMLEPMQRKSPGAGEVEVELVATGLIFRDVLIALGRYPGNSEVFGYECVGKIVALGAGVDRFQSGQKVIAMGSGSLASHITLPIDHVLPVPPSLTDCEAASIPSAFLTARYALSYLGKIAQGERILIHAAAGGVGLAAVQLALCAGAEVFATAGSPQKREYLTSLGVAHVMDSRSLDFAAEIMQITAGQGVDLVLNSLAGEFIEKSLSVMADNGRFLEIGMTGIWDKAQVSRLNGTLAYYPINLAASFQENPGLLADLLRELLSEFEQGRLKPLPLRIFPVSQVVEAFRYMARATHIGKIVLSHERQTTRRVAASRLAPEQELDANASYLVTGGLAGLGLLVAQWMVKRGARHLVLTGRSEPSEHTLQVMREMAQDGARIEVARGDVSDRNHLDQVVAKFGDTLPPLRGIIHSAGALDDGVLLNQSWARFQKVFAPKIAGSWHLHILTQHLSLDFFVMFSSAVSLLGSPGQGSHVAACAFQDGLAYYRRALGLPALSIDWGPWAVTGAATRGTVTERVQLKGFQIIQPEQGLRLLEDVFAQDRTRVGAFSLDWGQYASSLPPGLRSGFLSELLRKTEAPARSSQGNAKQTENLQEQLSQAPSASRQKLLRDWVRAQAITVLGLDSTQTLDDHLPLADLGLDSLMAVELRSLMSRKLGRTRSLPAAFIFDYPTVAAIANYLAEELLPTAKTPEPKLESSKPGSIADILGRIEDLSEEEVDRMYSPEKSI